MAKKKEVADRINITHTILQSTQASGYKHSASLVSGNFRSRRERPNLYQLSYGCYKYEDAVGQFHFMPLANNLNLPGLTAKTSGVYADIIEWQDPITNTSVQGAVNLSLTGPRTERGGTDPNPPHGGPPYDIEGLIGRKKATQTMLRTLPLFIPQVYIYDGPSYKGNILPLLIPITRDSTGKPWYVYRLYNTSDTFRVNIVEFKHEAKKYQVAVSPQWTT